jgi:Zinc carboxypeptidase
MSSLKRHSRLLAVVLAFVAVISSGILAQSSQNKQVTGTDDEFARLVREWTTRPDFISPLVDHLPKVAGIPNPKDVLGHYIGEPKKLTYYADILTYYRALAAKSPRVQVLTIGKTDEGRELVVVFVGSEESIKNLETYRTYLGQLADPRHLTDAQAKEIIVKAKPIYHVIGGLHSGEVGPSEMLMELAYRVATEDSPLVKQIRDNVIVSITPVADPDGRDRNVDWYYKYGIKEPADGRGGLAGVPYWGKYVFHDDNRDINYSQMEMRALLDWYLQWHPPIMHDLHQAQTLLYTFSGQAPQNPTLDPILYGEMPMMANFEMAQFAKYGMPGVWTHGFVDMWSPGYLAFMSSNHNGMIRMYEIQGFSGANTQHMRLGGAGGRGPSTGSGQAADGGRGGRGGRGAAPAPAGAAAAPAGAPSTAPANAEQAAAAPIEAAGPPPAFGGGQSSREWYRPFPATGEFDWSLRNNTNYGETGVLTALQYTSMFSKIILENFYQKSRNSIDAGRKDAVAGYVIPAGQRDMTRVATLVNMLRMQGIEVGRATSEVKLKEGAFPAGSFIVKRDQPYGRLAKILLEKQVYPDPTLRTYDDAAWTMGMMSQTDVKEIQDKTVLDVAVEPVSELKPSGSVAGSGSLFAVAHNGSNNMITLRYRLKDLKVQAVEKEFKQGDTTFPAGSFVISGEAARVKAAIEPLGLTAVGLAAAPSVAMHDLDLPRLAVFSTWSSTQDVGWVRYAFDKFEVAYDLIYKERVRKGDLKSAYDVIVIPHQAGTAKRLVFDIESRGTPIEYKKSDAFKNLGMYGESDDITGGMGLEGVTELDKFVKAGGVLITLGAASYFPAEFGLAPRVDAARTSAQFYAPGPIVDAEIVRPDHPIFYGYDKRTVPVRYGSGPLLSVQVAGGGRGGGPAEAAGEGGAPAAPAQGILMRYPGGDEHVLSGLMRGANEIRNRPAIVDMPSGKGRVILFAGNPCYRWQNFGEFNMLFNAVLNFNDIRDAAPRPAPTAEGR